MPPLRRLALASLLVVLLAAVLAGTASAGGDIRTKTVKIPVHVELSYNMNSYGTGCDSTGFAVFKTVTPARPKAPKGYRVAKLSKPPITLDGRVTAVGTPIDPYPTSGTPETYADQEYVQLMHKPLPANTHTFDFLDSGAPGACETSPLHQQVYSATMKGVWSWDLKRSRRG